MVPLVANGCFIAASLALFRVGLKHAGPVGLYLLSAVRYLLSAVCCLLSAVCCLLSAACSFVLLL
jgi:hypothetical protein